MPPTRPTKGFLSSSVPIHEVLSVAGFVVEQLASILIRDSQHLIGVILVFWPVTTP
jgi:hypothetical protein